MSEATEDVVAREIAVEQAHVDRVYTELAKAVDRAQLVHAEGMSRGQTDRRGTGDPREEELAGLFERDALVYSASRRTASLQNQHEGLVFGRLDLDHADTGEQADREIRYIGRLGVRDDEYDPLVIDWRAPAAAPFYRATPVEPHGVVRRRVLRSQSELVVGIEDDLMVADPPPDLVVVGDGALIAALSRTRGQRMRDIVATIQQHQDEAIRADVRGVTEITGGPGTGKTVVALHRAAYLLYSDRRRFESGGVLVVGPSAAYTAYIERVLPGLGEDSVVLRSMGDLVGGITATRVDSPETAAVKGGLRMRQVLNRLVREPIPDAPDLLRVFVAGQAIRLEAADLNRVRRTVLRHHQRNNSFDVAVRELAEAAWASVREGDREQFLDKFIDSTDVETFARQWWRPVDPREVLLWLAEPQFAARVVGSAFDGEHEAAAETLSASLRTALHTGTWSVADVALVDELAAKLGQMVDLPSEERGFYEIEELDNAAQYGTSALRVGVDGDEPVSLAVSDGSGERISHDPQERLMAGRVTAADDYAHVLVDEAQDLSPMQWRMLGRRGRWASWTVVGDAAQSSWPDPEESLTAREEAFGSTVRRGFHMQTNYRNAREIFEYAERLIRRYVPDADIPEAVRETGVDPVEITVDADAEAISGAVAEALAGLSDQVAGSVAVIAPRKWQPELSRVVGRHDGRVALIDPLSSKGLEWDATVVVDPDEIIAESPGGPRVLYVVLTRAAHRMTVLQVR
nr:AAA family ATPase [Ornithinimicrobium ciconiae]